jgi:transposase
LERWRRAVQLLEGGQLLAAVARMVGAAVSAVWQWRETFRRAGADGLAAKPVPGRPPELSPPQRLRLPKVLA